MDKRIILGIVIVAIVVSIIGLQSISSPPRSVGEQEVIKTPQTQETAPARVLAKEEKYPRAIEIEDPSGFINSEPFNLSDYVGQKVILVDFWTYSCINCQRTLPYLTAWDRKYRDDGLLIVGIHTPEFSFEEEYANVLRATQKFGVEYPVVLDNDRATWGAYRNHYWPHEYLIDIDGFIVHDHIGEGGYDETERLIQDALSERAEVLGLNMSAQGDVTDVRLPEFGKITTRETYFGAGRGETNAGPNTYVLPERMEDDVSYLFGTWIGEPEAALAGEGAGVRLRYGAKDVYMVAGGEGTVEVLVDGEQVASVPIADQTLYTLVSGSGYARHDLELHFTPGVRLYTFTFG